MCSVLGCDLLWFPVQLGKTVQTICVIAGDIYERRQRFAATRSIADRPTPTLIVCPATLVGHWGYEIDKFCPRKQMQPYTYTCELNLDVLLEKSNRNVDCVCNWTIDICMCLYVCECACIASFVGCVGYTGSSSVRAAISKRMHTINDDIFIVSYDVTIQFDSNSSCIPNFLVQSDPMLFVAYVASIVCWCWF